MNLVKVLGLVVHALATIESTITSFLLWREEEEHVTAKNSKLAEFYLAVPQSTTSQRTVTLIVNKVRVLQAYMISYTQAYPTQ